MRKPTEAPMTVNGQPTDKRKYPRHIVDFDATIDDGIAVQSCKVIDISREGCRIRGASTLDAGSYFRVDLRLFGLGDSLAVDLAVTRWVLHGDIGVEFICLSPENQERLRAIIQSCEDATGLLKSPAGG